MRVFTTVGCDPVEVGTAVVAVVVVVVVEVNCVMSSTVTFRCC